jgi:1-acyl-sn-glycerol-3-phosphate acyltransferase
MILLRSIVFLGFMFGTTVLFTVPIIFFGRVVPYRWLARWGRAWARLCLFGLKGICGLGYRVSGLEHLPREPAVVLCKHQSAWETIALRALFPPEQTWVLKQELFRLPFFGWALAPFGPIAIDRSQGRKAVRQLLEDGRKWLDAGRWVIVFPEGTRVPPGERRAYGIGGALMAEKTARAVVPVAHNAGMYWARRSILKQPGTIELVIGPPIETKGRRASDINREAEEWIESVVADLSVRRGV